jgi:death-on-curing protein
MPRFLSKPLVIRIHDYQVATYGGRPGILDEGLLDSALSQPKATFGGKFLHPTIPQMAAAYGFHLCQNHAFHDGNKRTARVAMLTFLRRNGFIHTASEFDLYAVMLALASGRWDKQQFTEWVRTVVKKMPM